MNAQKSVVVRVGRAIFSVIYVLCMLLALQALGFVYGGFMMRNLIEKPIQTVETLNFDYTKISPVALVPIISSYVIGSRFIPYNHKLQLIVSLTVPEFEYNRKLGVFQV